MHITTVLRWVPDTDAPLRVGADGRSLDLEGVRFVLNPHDAFALEVALRWREEGHVDALTVVTHDGDRGVERLRTALALGADRAILLRGPRPEGGLAQARCLQPAVEALAPDLVLTGRKSVESEEEQLGPALATFLGRPCVTAVTSFEGEAGALTCVREIDGGRETVQLSLPAVLTISKGEHDLRTASLKGIMAAKRKPLEEREAPAPGGEGVRRVALRLPAEGEGLRWVGEGPEAVPELVRRLRDEARVL